MEVWIRAVEGDEGQCVFWALASAATAPIWRLRPASGESRRPGGARTTTGRAVSSCPSLCLTAPLAAA
jgi:hypothetical protein